MKKYDFNLIKKIIEKFITLDVLEEASIGLHEDWFWTADTIWEDGKFKRDLLDNDTAYKLYEEGQLFKEKHGLIAYFDQERFKSCLVGGLIGSPWATPVIEIDFKDRTTRTFYCYTGESEVDILEKIKKEMACASGVLSRPIQELRDELEIETFIE